MSDVDLTQAVEDGAQALYEGSKALTAPSWDEQYAMVKFNYRESVMPIVTAAARDIARQAWNEGATAVDRDGLAATNPYENEEV